MTNGSGPGPGWLVEADDPTAAEVTRSQNIALNCQAQRYVNFDVLASAAS